MFKQQILWVAALLSLQTAFAQTNGGRRYKDVIFKDVSITTDQSYFPEAPKDDKKAYLFDLYQPKEDNATLRPLIIWMHGGGFKLGTKKAKAGKAFSRSFAERGYVAVSINYRLSKENPLLHFDALLRAAFTATQDAKRAVAYFRANSARYHIDPDKIIVAGNSAGGFMALLAAYSNNQDFGHMAGLTDEVIKSTALQHQDVYAVVNCWGAIFNLEWLKNGKTPIISIHGSEDGLVPITHKDAPLHGSLDILHKADELGIPNTLKIYEGYSHELQRHFNPFFEGSKAKGRWKESAQFIADYLYGMMNPRVAPR